MSELVTNAVRHASTRAGTYRLDLLRRVNGVRVALADESVAEPTVRDPDPSTCTGRGMRLISALAERWGVQKQPGGKSVWAEISAPTPA